MAKTEISEDDPSDKETKLKNELKGLINAILDEEDISVQTICKATEMMCALKELKTTKTAFVKPHEIFDCPDQFRCPLSKELMIDPVIIATGQTYDRPFIEKWLKSGNKTCPQTKEVLSHTTLTPNLLAQALIFEWCKSHGVQLPNRVQHFEEEITESDRSHFISMLFKLSSSPSDQKEAAKELRLLTKNRPPFRALFSESENFIPQLLNPLYESSSDIDPDLKEDVITTLMNISIHESNKILVAECPLAIPFLMEALKSERIETKRNAAAAFFTLSARNSNKELIGESGALKPLIDLLEEGNPRAIKDAAEAIFILCLNSENRARAVRHGAVRVIIEKLVNGIFVDGLLVTLSNLSLNKEAFEEMGDRGLVPCLLSIIRESSSAKNKENAVSILHKIVVHDRSKRKEVSKEENTHESISQLAKNGTPRAKTKANSILENLSNKSVKFVDTS